MCSAPLVTEPRCTGRTKSSSKVETQSHAEHWAREPVGRDEPARRVAPVCNLSYSKAEAEGSLVQGHPSDLVRYCLEVK